MVSLIINNSGWMSLCDKKLNVRWGNVDGMGRYDDVESGINAAYNKRTLNKRSLDPEWYDYSDLAYGPLLEWGKE